MIVEGRNAVMSLLQGGSTATVEKVLVSKETRENDLVGVIKNSGILYQFVDKAALDRHSKSKNHQGFIAFVTDFKYHDLDEIIENGYKRGNQPLILILDGVEDPHNLGNIIRTAECLGVDGLVIPKNRAVGVGETVIRVSAGAASFLPICKVTNINQEIEYLKEKGFWIFACEIGGINLAQSNMTGPLAIVMGGEHTGVRHHTKNLADKIISIPMKGNTPSLNVANATAVVLYEAIRQRGLK